MIKKQALIRVFADVVLVNLAIIAAMFVRFINLMNQKPGANPRREFLAYVDLFWPNAALITLICVLVFGGFGFYSYGRAYRGRYKALVVGQAVTIAYLIYGTLAFGLQSGFALPGIELRWTSTFTFSLWLLAGIFTAAMTIGARVWSFVWTKVKAAERLLDVQVDRPVEKVLLIGGGGYIGSALIPMLLAKGIQVRLLDRMLYGTEPIQDFLEDPRVELQQSDFRQVDEVVRAMRDIDAVVHLGALVGDPACALDEELTVEINLMATRMIAEVAKGMNVRRFVFASTCSVYGASDEILNERSALNPISLYAKSKIASERVLMDMAEEKFVPTCLRFGTIYGFSGRTRFDLVVNLLTAKAAFDGKITLYGGDQWRPFLHVEDAAQAVLRTLQAPLETIREEVFNVGSNAQNLTLEQVARLINQKVPNAEILELGSDSDRRNYQVNFDKIANALSFEAKWSLEDGIQQVLQAIEDGRVTDYTSSAYSNVKSLHEGGTSKLLRNERRWADELLADTVKVGAVTRA